MSWEPILILILLRYLQKSFKTFSLDDRWKELLKWLMYFVVFLIMLQIIFKLGWITIWIWYILLLFIGGVTFKLPQLSYARTVMLAIMPLIVLSLLNDLIKALDLSLYLAIKKYFGYAFVVSITWMIAMLILSNKQKKAWVNEQRKRQEEEEKVRYMEARKAELEGLVAERTAELMKQKEELQNALVELKATQTQLIQSEKMASLGELTAGIAHEIQNPLNFVNNFSEVSRELVDEMKHELMDGNSNNAIAIADDLDQNLEKIFHHGKRADAIVKGMLLHSRAGAGKKEPTDINALADEYLRLSYHGLRAKDKNFNASLITDFNEDIGIIEVVPQDVGRVLLNLYNNAFYSVLEKKKAKILNGEQYEPTVWVTTKSTSSPFGLEISIKDNGLGIPQKVVDKIFQPFFTTKPTGQGTGLGLSLSYDIITNGHGGEMRVKTQEGEGAEFTIFIPIKQS